MPKSQAPVVSDKVCPECKSKDVSLDRRTREYVCEACGLVFLVLSAECEGEDDADPED
jgi:rubredoxin